MNKLTKSETRKFLKTDLVLGEHEITFSFMGKTESGKIEVTDDLPNPLNGVHSNFIWNSDSTLTFEGIQQAMAGCIETQMVFGNQPVIRCSPGIYREDIIDASTYVSLNPAGTLQAAMDLLTQQIISRNQARTMIGVEE